MSTNMNKDVNEFKGEMFNGNYAKDDLVVIVDWDDNAARVETHESCLWDSEPVDEEGVIKQLNIGCGFYDDMISKLGCSDQIVSTIGTVFNGIIAAGYAASMSFVSVTGWDEKDGVMVTVCMVLLKDGIYSNLDVSVVTGPMTKLDCVNTLKPVPLYVELMNKSLEVISAKGAPEEVCDNMLKIVTEVGANWQTAPMSKIVANALSIQ